MCYQFPCPLRPPPPELTSCLPLLHKDKKVLREARRRMIFFFPAPKKYALIFQPSRPFFFPTFPVNAFPLSSSLLSRRTLALFPIFHPDALRPSLFFSPRYALTRHRASPPCSFCLTCSFFSPNPPVKVFCFGLKICVDPKFALCPTQSRRTFVTPQSPPFPSDSLLLCQRRLLSFS